MTKRGTHVLVIVLIFMRMLFTVRRQALGNLIIASQGTNPHKIESKYENE
jgi:hypothetical protein